MFQKKIWDQLWGEKEFSEWDSSSQIIYETLIKEAGDIRGKRILEAGSGTGRISLRLASEGADVTLLDFSEIAIEQSRTRFDNHGLKADFIIGDIMNMADIPDNSYDIVWNSGVLEHFDKNQLFSSLTEMKRILKTDGMLITINPNAKSLLYRLGKWYMEKTDQWSYGQELPIYTLKDIGEDLGLFLLDEYSIGFKESLDFFSFLPESHLVKAAFENWFTQLSINEQAEIDGYLLVSVFKTEPIRKEKENSYYLDIREEKNLETILMLSSVHFHEDLWQRPQQLAVEMAKKGKSVVFLNGRPKVMRVGWNLKDHGLPANLFIKKLLQGKECQGVMVVDRIDTLVDPFGNSLLVRDQYIREFIRFYRKEDTTVLTYFAESVKELEHIKNDAKIFYDCVDERTSDSDTRQLYLDEKRLLEIVDGVIVTSNTLFVHKARSVKSCFLIPNAVNYEDFIQPRDKPVQLANLAGPIIGYVGAVASWFDQELIVNVARQNQEMNFVIVGKIYTDVTMLKQEPNIYLIGPVEYTMVPAFMQHFDAGIIPFKINELIINTNPIKYFEYLAAGIQTISTPLPELVGKPYCNLAGTADEFTFMIKKVLSNKDVIRDLSYLNNHTWSTKADEIIAIFSGENDASQTKGQILSAILKQYDSYNGAFPILNILKAEIYHELGEIDKARKLFENHDFKNLCLSTQLKLYLEWNDYERMVKVLSAELQDNHIVELMQGKGSNYIKMYAYCKIGEIEKAVELAQELLAKDEAINEDLGNIYYEFGNEKLAAMHYFKAFKESQKLRTKIGAERFSSIAEKNGQLKLATYLKNLNI